MRDFDAAFAEAADEPIRLRLFDQEWEIPRQVAASAVLQAWRLSKSETLQDLGPEASIDFARTFIGDEIVSEWLDRGITIPQLEAVVDWVLDERKGGGGGAAGEAPPAKPASAST